MSRERYEELVEQLAREIGRKAAEDWIFQANYVSGHCDSPIERIMLAALWAEALISDQAAATASAKLTVSAWLRTPDGRKRAELEIHDTSREGLHIRAQAPVGDYTVDILLHWYVGGVIDMRVAIECDGHEFHEKTKEQVARDKSRDRALQIAGVRVFRFSGSEIYRRPRDCAREVLAFVNKEHAEAWRRALDQQDR